jgi:hypothetical protein
VEGVKTGSCIRQTAHHFFHKGGKASFIPVSVHNVEFLARDFGGIVAVHGNVEILGNEGV